MSVYREMKRKNKSTTLEEANTTVDEACKKLLANLIMEEYSFQIQEVK